MTLNHDAPVVHAAVATALIRCGWTPAQLTEMMHCYDVLDRRLQAFFELVRREAARNGAK